MRNSPIYINPFKNKRSLLRARLETENEIERLKRLSEAIIEQWRLHCSETGITLVTEPRSHQIRWRATKKIFSHQRILTFDSDEITGILPSLSDDALRLLLGFEHRRLEFNLRCTLARNALAELNLYAEESHKLEALAPEGLKTPLVS